ncbi:arsenic transporter [Hymenobacter sp. BRD128]|uniref:arsenic transporter n=1 Tax=Hymenobacter sp. BRD128 TaxID=2675878 RepID=UPI0015652324|nr:arsenic transporter [Hymenobacter sp. BRD128]QKG56514.1 arsenic transporter [Hymenobacter sp. BRD128]
MHTSISIIWAISALSIALVIIRPFQVPEYVWAVSGAVLLLLFRLLTPAEGLAGVARGLDVYLFLTGMMLLAETAREEKLFDWLAAHATQLAKGSAPRLFLLVYLVGVLVTTFLSNDATAVVLTPAVASAVRAARVKNPLPYLFSCAFIANAASFVLPISNPANLVIYGAHIPPLLVWLPHYLLPAAVSIVATYFILLHTQKVELGQDIAQDIELPTLERGGQVALAGIGVTAVALLAASALDSPLGLPTAITGILTAIIVLFSARKSPVEIVKNVSWSVLPLVAGLFVLVEALNKTGVTRWLTTLLNAGAAQSAAKTTWVSGVGIALLCNVLNNLPAGLIAGNVLQTAHVPELVKSAVLIGIDLGPNLSVTGSLATILWLVALRRENVTVSTWQFLKLGALVMTVPLLLAIGSLFLLPR